MDIIRDICLWIDIILSSDSWPEYVRTIIQAQTHSSILHELWLSVLDEAKHSVGTRDMISFNIMLKYLWWNTIVFMNIWNEYHFIKLIFKKKFTIYHKFSITSFFQVYLYLKNDCSPIRLQFIVLKNRSWYNMNIYKHVGWRITRTAERLLTRHKFTPQYSMNKTR